MLFLTGQVKSGFLATCEGITKGSLRLWTPEGTCHDFGQGAPVAEMRIHDWSVVTATLARGDIGFGETYVQGLWDTPSVEMLIQIAILNLDQFKGYAYAGFWQNLKFRTLDRLMRVNSPSGAARNIRAHYDVGNEFFQLWLDPGMTYSSALFQPGENDLLSAQNRKYDRILDRLNGGERVLEVGCGWGGFAERAADRGRHVTGLTISPSQKGYADARLDGRAEILLQDYRASGGTYDNIVSIEMIEAVGQRYWPTFFATLKARLAQGGQAVLQVITVPDDYFDTYRRSSDFIRRHIFPGGMLLSNAQIAAVASKSGLVTQNTFSFGEDYARTCRIWAEQLEAQAGRALRFGYDDRFLRSWRYYLGACAGSFALGHTNVVQVELTHV